MAALTSEQKIWIVEQLAVFRTPSEVASEFHDEFGSRIDRRHVWVYDAANPRMARRLSKDLKELFESTRKHFLEHIEDIPIAARAYRLRALNDMERKARDKGNAPLAAQLLEQAAKESGGAFTNRRELTGANGAAIKIESQTVPVDYSSLSDEELDELERIAAKLNPKPARDPGGQVQA